MIISKNITVGADNKPDPRLLCLNSSAECLQRIDQKSHRPQNTVEGRSAAKGRSHAAGTNSFCGADVDDSGF